MPDKTQETKTSSIARKQYSKPMLKRWGTLRELTRGGGGTKQEPSKRRTRF